VYNKTYIPEEIQMQIFQRSFSSKGADRGLGTYSIKLLTERYLEGKVYFTSSEKEGTKFFIELPVIPEKINKEDDLY
jgi:sensor histidine kinase regulating citrate/malate metabolism